MTCNCDKGVDIDRTMSTYKEEFTHSFSLREIWKNGEWKYKKFCFKMNSILYNHLLCLQSGNSTAYCKWNYIGSINIYAASVSSCYLLKSCKSHMDLTYLKKKKPCLSIYFNKQAQDDIANGFLSNTIVPFVLSFVFFSCFNNITFLSAISE